MKPLRIVVVVVVVLLIDINGRNVCNSYSKIVKALNYQQNHISMTHYKCTCHENRFKNTTTTSTTYETPWQNDGDTVVFQWKMNDEKRKQHIDNKTELNQSKQKMIRVVMKIKQQKKCSKQVISLIMKRGLFRLNEREKDIGFFFT